MSWLALLGMGVLAVLRHLVGRRDPYVGCLSNAEIGRLGER